MRGLSRGLEQRVRGFMVIQTVVAGKVERVRNFWYDASVHKHRVKNSSNNWNHCQSLKIAASFFFEREDTASALD